LSSTTMNSPIDTIARVQPLRWFSVFTAIHVPP
jgi:hypothetical protein